MKTTLQRLCLLLLLSLPLALAAQSWSEGDIQVNRKLATAGFAPVKVSFGTGLATNYNDTLKLLTINSTITDVTLGSYANPSWITSLAWSKITGAPSFLTGNQTITLSGAITGSGATSIVTSLAANAARDNLTGGSGALDLSTFTLTLPSDVTRLGSSIDLGSEVTGTLPWASVSKTGSSLADLTTRSAGDLTSGTLPDARFPATLPAANGSNLTSLDPYALQQRGATNGQALVWSTANSRWQPGTVSGGSSTFLDLTDTPASYSGQANKYVRVNGAETALEFTSGTGGINDGDTLTTGLTFPDVGLRIQDNAQGSITGTIAFDDVFTANRTLGFVLRDANRLIDLSGDLAVSAAATISGTNTGDVTVTDTDTLDLTLAGQDLSGAVRVQQSITSDASGIKLSGDSASPGNSKYYGTNSGGTRGFYDLPSGGGLGYTLIAGAIQHNPTDSQVVYIGSTYSLAPGTTVDVQRIYIPKAGTIKAAYVYGYANSATHGSGESWNMSIRLNNTTDYSIADVAATTQTRVWSNTALSIAVVAGDYIEIKSTQPAWATNPVSVRYNAVIYIE